MPSSNPNDTDHHGVGYPSEHDSDDTSLFVSESSRKRRLDWDHSSNEDTSHDYLSEEDIDWETLPLEIYPENPAPTEFCISIGPDDADLETAKLRSRERIRLRQYRISLHYLSMASYMLFALRRNRALSSPVLLKRLKALIPMKFMKSHIKPFFKRLLAEHDPKQMDVQFIYILKYLVKWLRYNYSLSSNAIRVLGYMPPGGDPKDYFPEPAPSLLNDNDWKHIIKQFLHNRDTAAHLLVAILRSLGLDARLVLSLPLLSVKSSCLKVQPKVDCKKLVSNRDNDLLYPYFWVEVVNPCNPNELIILEASAFHDESKWTTRCVRVSDDVIVQLTTSLSTPLFYPIQDRLLNSMEMHNVILLTPRNTIIDVSPRYMRNICYRAFGVADMQTHLGRTNWLFKSLIRCLGNVKRYNSSDLAELSTLRSLALLTYDIPRTVAQIKQNPNFTTISCLRYNECIKENARPVSTLKFHTATESIYSRSDVVVGRTELQWKFRGRSVKISETNSPIKEVRARQPRTMYNRRLALIDEATSPSGPAMTKLYSFSQTRPYIKPILSADSDGQLLIPRNKFGDCEVYRPNMVPDGCEWLKHPGIEKVFALHNSSASGNSIQFVSVVTGFNFSAKANAAIAVKDGVLVLQSQAQYAHKIWLAHVSQEEQKQLKASLTKWALVLRSLKIASRLDQQYGAAT